ncbi:MAG: PEP-CTERM sorting domain-containing protein [Halioglobus sp.]
MDSKLKKSAIHMAVAASLVGFTAVADASHFRGSAMIPTITTSPTGAKILTVVDTAFWRTTLVGNQTVRLNGSNMSQVSQTTDTSDSRYTVRTTTWTRDITNVPAGLLQITASSNARVATSGSLANWRESSWTMNSAIAWDGTNDTSPIDFDFTTIQPEVSRLAGNDYTQSLNATSADGLTLTYNQNLNQNILSQIPGFTVDPVTGVMTIVGDANRAAITDNTSNSGRNPGADAAFSGNIIASNGSFVEFDWMFDGVDAAANNAPVVDDAVINALVGTGIAHTFIGNDAEDGALTNGASWDATLQLSGNVNMGLPTFDVNNQLVSWDTTGYAPGTYLISARAFDSQSVGDFGTLTVNLCQSLSDPLCGGTPPPPPPPGVPVPGTLALFGLGVSGLGWQLRRRKKGIA